MGCVHVLCMWIPVCCALVHSENKCVVNITATIIQVRRLGSGQALEVEGIMESTRL